MVDGCTKEEDRKEEDRKEGELNVPRGVVFSKERGSKMSTCLCLFVACQPETSKALSTTVITRRSDNIAQRQSETSQGWSIGGTLSTKGGHTFSVETTFKMLKSKAKNTSSLPYRCTGKLLDVDSSPGVF